MARKAWDTLEQIGDPLRGFVDMGSEIWVVASSAAYSAVMVAAPGAKPGLLLDRIESQLLIAEEARAAEAAEAPAAPAAPEPVRRPRSPLHPEPRLDAAPQPMPEPEPTPEPTPETMPEPVREPVKAGAKVVDLSAPSAPATRADDPPAGEPEAKPTRARKLIRRKKPATIDRVALAREFGRLQSDNGAGGF